MYTVLRVICGLAIAIVSYTTGYTQGTYDGVRDFVIKVLGDVHERMKNDADI